MTGTAVMRVTLLTVLFATLPDVAFAQRGGRGMGSRDADWNAVAGSTPRGPSITGKDFKEASPLTMLLDKKKQLNLTDVQVASIAAAEQKLQAANAERYALVDSLKKQMRPSAAPSAEDEARLAIARESMQGVVRDIRASHEAETKPVVATLDADQQKLAAELLEKHAEKVQKMLRDKIGGGGPGVPGGPGRRGPGR